MRSLAERIVFRLNGLADVPRGRPALTGTKIGCNAGEPALIATAPAILNTIAAATGVRLTQIPATPDRARAVLQAPDTRMTTTHAATDAPDEAALRTALTVEPGIVTCDACPVLCRIRPGKTGACDRYGNIDGTLTRRDPLTRAVRSPDLVRFAGDDWAGNPIAANAVDLPGYAAIDRRTASEIDPTTDLGDRLITFGVGPLTGDAIETALDAGRAMADTLLRDGLIEGAVLTLRGRVRVPHSPLALMEPA